MSGYGPPVRQARPKAGGLALAPGQRCRLIFTKDYPAAHCAKFLPCGAGLGGACLTSFLPGSLALVRDFGPGCRNYRNEMTKARELVGFVVYSGSSATIAVAAIMRSTALRRGFLPTAITARKPAGSIVDAAEPRIRELLRAYPTMPAAVIAEADRVAAVDPGAEGPGRGVTAGLPAAGPGQPDGV